ncbi:MULTISPECIES: aminotransferase-like domain-containing protein [unclassified Marinovum]
MDTISIGDISGFDGPKYRAVAEAIRAAVARGEMAVGQKLPPVRELAWTLQITPGTVARAYTLLTDEGLLQAEVGRGTFVADAQSGGSETPPLLIQYPMQNADTVPMLSPCLPDVGQVDAIRRAMRRAAERNTADLLDYPSNKPYEPARKAAARWLNTHLPSPVRSDEVVLTHGGQNGICLVMQCVLRGRRPVVLVEELSYPGFRRAAEILRAEVVPVPIDEHGLIPEELDRLARTHSAQLLCTSPDVQSPTLVHTPLKRRREIAAVAEARGFDILEDGCYRRSGTPLPNYRMILPGQSWYVASISKSLTPALRIGVALASDNGVAALRRVAEYGFFGLSRPLADLTELLLGDPAVDVLAQKVSDTIARYVRAAVNALGTHDLSWHESVPFVWLRLPEGWRAAAFCQAAEAEGLQIRSAEGFALREARVPHAVRIAINAQVKLETFEDAMQRLRRLLDDPPENIGV